MFIDESKEMFCNFDKNVYNSANRKNTALEVRMDKRQFLDDLRRCLKGKIDDRELESNISFYSSYIDRQMAEGKTEKEVLDELGSPRLIAKTIIQTYQMKDDPIRRRFSNRTYTETDEEKDFRESYGKEGFMEKLRKILILVCVILIVLVVISVLFKVISFLIPLIAIILAIVLIMRMLDKKL